MKKLSWLLLTCLFIYGCKKDSSSGKQLLLSKVFDDGLLAFEYIYTQDNKPVRRDNYNTGTGQSVHSGFRLYNYSMEGLLEDVTDFNKNNQFGNKYALQYDVNKRLTRMNDLASDNSIQHYYLFDYGPNGKLSNYTLYNATTSKKTLDASYTYNAEGAVTMIKRISYLNTSPTLYDSSTFIFENKNFPAHWSSYFELLPVVALPVGDNLFYNLFCTSSYRYYVDAPPMQVTVTYSEKVYNNAGLPVKQHIKYENKYLGAPIITNKEMTYEYISN